MLKKKLNRLATFIHAGKEQNNFEVTLLDCFKAFENAKMRRWFNPCNFDSKEYDKYSQIDEGDLNWIIPGQILAMASPSINRFEGMPSLVYQDLFKSIKVSAIVRLREKLYIEEDFQKDGIRVYPLEIPEGHMPDDNDVIDFLMICENETIHREGVVAVHCKSGLCRTGTLIACYLMYKFNIEPRVAIAWIRMCRPGSITSNYQ